MFSNQDLLNKKTLITSALFVSSFAVALEANSNLTVDLLQTKHPKEIYANHNKVYSPSSDIYFFVGLKPKSEKRVLLKNEESIRVGKPVPVSLGGEGPHSLTHPWSMEDLDIPKDHLSRKMKVYYDGSAPNAKLYINENSQLLDRTNINYLKPNTELFVTATDGFSGVAKIYIGINDGDILELNADEAFRFNDEGLYDLKTIAVDNVGNIAAPFYRKVFIDGTAPKTEISINSNAIAEDSLVTLGANSFFALNAVDNGVGVAKIFYNIEGEELQLYTDPIKMDNLKSGKYTISYHSVDKIDNIEEMKTKSFYVDKTAPTTALKVNGDFYKTKEYEFISPRSTIELFSEDFSKVESIKYSLGEYESDYTEPFSLAPNYRKTEKEIISPSKAQKNVTYYSIDELGNEESKKTANFIVDRSAPKSKVAFSGAHVLEDDTHYINRKTKIEIISKDNLSGVKEIQHYFDENQKNDYTGGFNLTDQEENKELVLSVVSTDNVNNKSEAVKSTILIDTMPPVIYSHMSFNGLKAQEVTLKGEEKVEYPTYTDRSKFYIGASDDFSGVSEIYYAIDNAQFAKYNAPIRFDKKPGVYNLNVKVIDKVGNESYQESQFRIVSFKDKRIIKKGTLGVDYKEK